MLLGLSIGLSNSLGSGGGSVPESDIFRVRRSTDSAEADYTLTEVDDGTLDTFVGAGDGCVATWYDDSGNDNDVIQATTTLQPKVAVSGTVQEGVKFDGTDDYLTLGARLTSGAPTELTVACFVKTTSGSGQKYIAAEALGPSNFMWVLALNAGKLEAYIDAAGTAASGTAKDYLSTALINDGNWHHVAFVFGSSALTVYIDGAVATVTKTYDGTVSALKDGTTAQLWLGRYQASGAAFPGSLSGLYVAQSALTAGNIATLAAGGEVGSPLLWLKGNYSP